MSREKTYLLTCAPNEDSNQPAHSLRLIRVFVVHMKKLYTLSYPNCAQWRFWSHSANAQAELNLRWTHIITKTYLYNVDPLYPNFYIVKLGFTGLYVIFLISAQKHRLWVLVRTSTQKHRLWYSLEPPRQGGSNEYPQSMFWAVVWKISELLSEKLQVLVVKFSIYLNRRVFVMCPWVHFLTLRIKYWRITKTRLFKYIENFTSKNWKFSDKKNLIFFIFLLKT